MTFNRGLFASVVFLSKSQEHTGLNESQYTAWLFMSGDSPVQMKCNITLGNPGVTLKALCTV